MYQPFCDLFPDQSEQPWLKRARLKKGNAWGLEAGDYVVFDLYTDSPSGAPAIYFTVEQVKTSRLMLTARYELGPGPGALSLSTRHLQSPQAPKVLEWLREMLSTPALEQALAQRLVMYSSLQMREMFEAVADEPQAQQELLTMLRQMAPPDMPQQEFDDMMAAIAGDVMVEPAAKSATKSGKAVRGLKVLKNGGLLLKVSLRGAPLPIWRKLELPASLTLTRAHAAIQAAMGWQDCHLWMFSDGRKTFMPTDERSPAFGEIDPDDIQIGELLQRKGDKLLYTYDMGDSWEHVIEVVELLEQAVAPAVIAGENACPPEDCGGVWGYAELLTILAKKRKSKADRAFLEWIDNSWDPTEFDLAFANKQLIALLGG